MKIKKIISPIFGSDFELFLFDKISNEVINAKKYVKGSKENPFNFDKSNPFWCTSLDNISMEGNIPPCTTGKEFSDSIKKVIDYMNSKLPAHMCTIHDPAVYVNEKYLRTKEARTFGCNLTLNAYTLRDNPPPDGESTTLRTCCTHIHMSYDDMDIFTSAEWVKTCDLFLGVPSLVIEPMNPRRSLYGAAGEMRYNNKTVEYRVLSSFFSQTPELREWIFNNALQAVEFLNSEQTFDNQMIRETIESNNIDLAKQIIEQYNIPMPQ